MRARVLEFMLSCWLTASPFIFHLSDCARAQWWTALVAAIGVGGASQLTGWPSMDCVRLFTIGMASWLIGFRRFGLKRSPRPEMQREIVVGLQ